MQRGQVREKLLRSASELAAGYGIGAMTLRSVVRAAGTNLNSIHYHFGSRDALIEELAARSQMKLNAERFDALDQLQGRPDSQPAMLEEILAAAYGPLFSQALGTQRQEHRAGLCVIQQLRFDPSGLGLEVLDKHAGKFIQRVEALVARELNLGATRIRTGMQLANAAAWDLALRPDTLQRIEALRHVDRGVRRLIDRFASFAAAGLRAVR